MKISSVSGINLAEDRTFRSFIMLYSVMSLVILFLFGAIFFESRKSQMLAEHMLSMQVRSESYIPNLEGWLQYDSDSKTFPRDIAYHTGLYSESGQVIASNLSMPHENFKNQLMLKDGYIHYIIPLASYELANLFLVFETKDDRLWLYDTLFIVGVVGGLFFLILLGLGYGLARLFMRPMNEAVRLLDHFIKDTTHELNTPISTILTNIETLQAKPLDPSLKKKIGRINIAAQTISTLYDDLTYLILNHKLIIKNEPIYLKEMVLQRTDYFKCQIEQKMIKLVLNLDDVTLTIDRTKIIRVIDNLLSNAIKYNRRKGAIEIELKERMLKISDSGRGIAQEKIKSIFRRYTRVDESVGGFGIGLNIVAMIASEYELDIDVKSEVEVGTTITLRWAG